MNIVTMASRKGGAGKSTLTAHLAALCHQAGHRTIVIDADPQGSLTLWHSLRPERQPDLRSGARGIERALAMAMVEGYQWAFIDTAASMWVVAQAAIRAATLVLIPARPGFFDLNAVRETVAAARERNEVKITIGDRLAECVGAERLLESHFGIEEAIVVPLSARGADATAPGAPAQRVNRVAD